MQSLWKLILVSFFFSFFSSAFAGTETNLASPVGYWQTIDDVTGKPRAIVKIWLTTTNDIYGRIIKIYPRPGHSENELCRACPGRYQNTPIKGMLIISNLRQEDSHHPLVWSKGKIFDPSNGKSYHCTLTVLDNGRVLNVRGYIGLPLFGRSQTWLRVTEPQDGTSGG